MSRRGRRRTKSSPFTMVPNWLTNTAAWRDLDPVARALYLELRQRFNGTNNGFIGMGCREAGEALNVGRNVARRAFDSLLRHGFLHVAQGSTFDQKRLAREWLLTELKDDRNGHLASKDFTRWTPSEQNIGTPACHIGTRACRENGNKRSHQPYRHTSVPIDAELDHLQAHERATYTSTIPRRAP